MAHVDGGIFEWLKHDLRKTIATTLAQAVLVGSGALDPLGIINRTPGSGSISTTTVSSTAPTWAQVTTFDKIVENLNSHEVDGTAGWALDVATKYLWANTPKIATTNTAGFIFEPNSKTVNGHKAFATNVLNGQLVFSSRWSSVLVLIPGTIGIVVDDRTQAHRNMTRFTIDLLCDVVLRRPESIVIASTI